jgi:hypothetical protein
MTKRPEEDEELDPGQADDGLEENDCGHSDVEPAEEPTE